MSAPIEIHRELQRLEAQESELLGHIADALAVQDTEVASRLIDQWAVDQRRQTGLLTALGEALARQFGGVRHDYPVGPTHPVTGRIIRLVRDRGFGFIRAETGGEILSRHGASCAGARRHSGPVPSYADRRP